jgi:Predicted hydrolase (metallo-beta-lactamase superfamily)
MGSGVSEFRRIIDYRRSNSRTAAKWALADRLLWRNTRGSASLFSLAPSDRSVEVSYLEIAKLVEEVAEHRIVVPASTPNTASIVLWVEIEGSAVLLGGDLEESTDPRQGWRSIVASDTRPAGRAEVYKVAHHGSITAHSDDIWNVLLESGNISVIAPWRRGGGRLPTENDLVRIAGLSRQTFVTDSALNGSKPVRRSRLVEDEMRKATRSWHKLDGMIGHVQLRRRAGEPWHVGLSSSARQYVADLANW